MQTLFATQVASISELKRTPLSSLMMLMENLLLFLTTIQQQHI